MLFELTDLHVRDGALAEGDYSSVAGFGVPVLDYRDFLHADELMEKHALDDVKVGERAASIWQRCQELGIVEPQGVFQAADVLEMARQTFSSLQVKQRTMSFDNVDFFRHFKKIVWDGDFMAAHAPDSLVWCSYRHLSGGVTRDVFPGLLSERIPVGALYRKAAVVMMRHHQCSPVSLWGNRTRMDDGLMVNYPRDGMGNLLCDLFSLRQMQQISVSSPFADVPAYYCNLDADLASRAVMRRKNVGAQTLQAHLNARYLEMLSSSPRYWVASALEDLEAGEKPADFYAVACGVGELRVRLQGEISGHNLDHLSSKKMQDSFSVWFQCAERPVKDVIPAAQLDREIENFGAHFQTILRRDPSPLYTHLRRVRERKVMTDPFVDRLAQKILLAAYSFNPNLLFADKERPSFRGADRVYGDCRFG